MVQTAGGAVPTGHYLRAFLFAALKTNDPDEPIALVPRERSSGVPDFYLLHVTDELQPSSDTAGRAVQLDGVDDRLTVAADPSLDIRRKLTVEFWFKADTLDFGPGNVWMPIVYKGDEDSPSVAERSYSVWLNSAGYLHFTSANGTSQDGFVNTAAGSVAADEWHHFAGVMDRDSGTMRAYLDGVLVNTGVVGTLDAALNADDPLLIGDTFETDSSFTPFKGTIDELRIWNVARSESDIQHATRAHPAGQRHRPGRLLALRGAGGRGLQEHRRPFERRHRQPEGGPERRFQRRPAGRRDHDVQRCARRRPRVDHAVRQRAATRSASASRWARACTCPPPRRRRPSRRSTWRDSRC